ncbi:MAG: fructose-6-phosphate aldolase [Planctomycetota bacterium]|nr:fructose-6-phosphate aldolase [Planctomycetota bacterium]
MKFFVDTGEIDEIREAAKLGILDGVTTNPSLVAKSGRKYKDLVKEICDVTDGPISAEVLSTDYDGMMFEAHEWHKVADNVVVKLPLIEDGIKACVTCTKEGIKTNVTLCFGPTQALLAAKAGATFVSPFVGRLDDIAYDGLELIREIRKIYDNYKYKTEILTASVRGPLHIRDAALAGADIATIPFKVFGQLLKHPLTDVGLKKFVEDSAKIPKGTMILERDKALKH